MILSYTVSLDSASEAAEASSSLSRSANKNTRIYNRKYKHFYLQVFQPR